MSRTTLCQLLVVAAVGIAGLLHALVDLTFSVDDILTYPPDCPECINIPLMLSDTKRNIMTNLIFHLGDAVERYSAEVCERIGGDSHQCSQSVSNTILKEDWIKSFNLVFSFHTGFQLSRHEILILIKRLRRFPSPRRLLVLGATYTDMLLWEQINGKEAGGYTCFVNRTFAKDNSMSVDKPFVRVIYDVEKAIDPSRSYTSPRDAAEMSLENPANYSTIPWDVVLLYDLCKDDYGQRAAPVTEMDMKTTQAQMHLEISCSQKYLEYATQIVSDTGYVFLHTRPGSAMFRTSLYGLENKFLYRHHISSHIGGVADSGGEELSTGSLVFYTSQEFGHRTIAGKRGFTQSDSLQEIRDFVTCISSAFNTSNFVNHSTQASESASSVRSPWVAENREEQYESEKYIQGGHYISRQSLLGRLGHRGYSRVIGILFCCRRRYSEILIPYLIRNLVSEGGIVDQYLVYNFGTEDGDEEYPAAVAAIPGFSPGKICPGRLFFCAYESLGEFDPNAIFIKVDDDILFLAEGALEHLVWDKLDARDGAIVHGNGVNHMHAPYFHSILIRERGLDNSQGSDAGVISNTTSASSGHMEPHIERARYHHSDKGNDRRANNGGEEDGAVYSLQNLLDPLHNRPVAAPYVASLISLYGRSWQQAAVANAQHLLLLDVMYGRTSLDSAGEDAYFLRPTSTRDNQNKQAMHDSDARAHRLDGEHNHDAAFQVKPSTFTRYTEPSIFGSATGVSEFVDPLSAIDALPQSAKMRLRERQYWFESFDLNSCACTRPQPGYGVCSRGGFYRTSINLVAFSWRDIAPHLDLLEVNDEIALTVEIPQRSGVHQIMSGKALYSHAAFTPQRLDIGVKFDEAAILSGYKDLCITYWDMQL